MKSAEIRNRDKQGMHYKNQDSSIANNSRGREMNGHAKSEPRSIDSSPRQLQHTSKLSEEMGRQRRRVEFVYPRDDKVHPGNPYQFQKLIGSETKVNEAKEGEKPNGNSKQLDKRVLALLRLDDEVSKSVETDPAENEDQKSIRHHLSGLSVEDAVRDKVGCRPRANSTDGELNLPQRGLCDERAVLESHRWTIYGGDRKELPPRGFQNLGNTCFLNSTLQCLAYLPPFCQSLLALMQSSPSPLIMSSQSANQIGKKDASTPGKRITWILRSLFQQIHGGKDSNASNITHAIAPRAIVSALPTIGTCGSRNGYKFRLGRQEDAHEFLVHLLDAMQDGELRAAGINQHASGWRDRLPVPRLDETTFVHRIFGGYLRSQVQCTSCGYLSNTYDPFLDLALEVSRQSSTSVATALAEFTKKETLDSQNRWKCSGCHKHVCATKQLTVFRPPLALCIQLKRFSFASYGGNNSFASGMWNKGGRVSGNKIFNHNVLGRGGSKITKPIEFPADLNLPLSDKRSCAYSLTGVVIHVGGSASSGHYTAYVKKPVAGSGYQWFHMDDSFVEQVSEKQVLRQKDSYVLFYCRKEVKLEFPAPPKASMTTAAAKQLAKVRAKAAATGRLEANQHASQEKTMSHGVSISSMESVTSEMNSTSQDSLSSETRTLLTPATSKESSRTNSRSTQPAVQLTNKLRLDPPGRTLEPVEANTSEESDSDSESSVSKDFDTESLNGRSNPSASVMTKTSGLSADASGNSADKGSQSSRSGERASITTLKSVLSGSLGHEDPLTPFWTETRPRQPNLSVNQDTEEAEGKTRGPAKSQKISSKQTEVASTWVDGSDDKSSDETTSGESSTSSSDDSTSSDDRSSSTSADDDESLTESPQVGKSSRVVVSICQEGSISPLKDSVPSSTGGTIIEGMAATTSAKSTATNRSSQSGSLASDSSDGKSRSVSESSKQSKPQEAKDPSGRTRVVLDRGGAHGKLEVVLGHRSAKGPAWKPNVPSHDQEHELLGNRAVGRWDDEDDNEDDKAIGDNDVKKSSAPLPPARSSEYRAQVVKRMEDSERSRKRKMHLDRWDAHLDQGKQKKVKAKQDNATTLAGFSDPKKNVFQRIQSGLQRMNKGRAKGLFHLNKKHPPPQRHGKFNQRRPPR